jgi:hypothetical protein
VLNQELNFQLFVRAVSVELLQVLFQVLKEQSFVELFKEPPNEELVFSSSFLRM